MEISLKEFFFLLIVLISNIIQTITGFAGTVLAMPASIALLGYGVAKPILTFIVIPASIVLVISNFKAINFKKFIFMLAFVGVGFIFGYLISLINLDSKLLLIIYGSIICLIAIGYMFFNFDKIQVSNISGALILILAGILHYLYTSGGPLVIIYALSNFKEKKEFRGTLSLMWIILNSILFVEDIVGGFYIEHNIFLTIYALTISIASILIGILLEKKINQKVFVRITYVLLFISGLISILTNIF